MDRVKKKLSFGYLILIVISLGLALSFAELVLRYFFAERVLPDSIAINSGIEYRIPHPVLGWELEPGGSYVNRIGEATVKVAYNSKGFRDVEHTVENPRGVFRVLVLGDSFMEAYSVELNQAFHGRVEEIAGQMGSDIEVINMGVGGYGTLQEYLVFKEVGQQYGPDLVLLGFFVGNDVKNNSYEIESLVYSGPMKIESRPFLGPANCSDWEITRVNFEKAQRRYTAEKAKRSTFLWKLTCSSALVQLIVKTKEKIHKRVSSDTEDNADVANASNILGLYGTSYCIETTEYVHAWDITKRILARLKKDIKAIGSKLVVFSVPAIQDVSVPYMEKIRREVPNPELLCFEKAPGYVRLNNILDELKIDFIDLLPGFRGAMREGANLFRREDRHWNQEGHSLAGQIVVPILIEKDLLPLR